MPNSSENANRYPGFPSFSSIDGPAVYSGYQYGMLYQQCDILNRKIMKALYDIGFDGPIRPDHGRMIWGEVAMPGYGLYDRALGATYLQGLWEAIEKSR